MSALIRGLAAYREPRLLAILLMGFSSGLPLALTFSTLSVWLRQAGISRTDISLFGLAGLAYTWKFAWSPLVDRLPVPLLTRWLGRRRSWAVLLQIGLLLALLALGQCDPTVNVTALAACTVVVAFLSASQDIVIDAFRVDLLTAEQQGAGAAATQLGYRLGMIASGAGALYLADAVGWQATYRFMAALMLIGVATVLLTPEPRAPAAPAGDWLKTAVLDPFADFMRKPGWILILLFILLYKLGDATAGHLANVFYVDTGFSNTDIANVSKLFGVGAAMLGIFLGGIIVHRLGVMRALLVCGVLQMASNLMYIPVALAGPDVGVLTLSVATENIAGGMGSAAFVAYLSGLCSPAYTATQYALLSSLMAVPRTFLASLGGAVADQLGWIGFFGFATAMAIPGLLLLVWLLRRQRPAIPLAKGGLPQGQAS
ncbi:MAG TPA: MFS transporter [Stellaceae bacterium]|nr:MFS transporter [Stellaceae bacterium]